MGKAIFDHVLVGESHRCMVDDMTNAEQCQTKASHHHVSLDNDEVWADLMAANVRYEVRKGNTVFLGFEIY